jgi:hypothetical protein
MPEWRHTFTFSVGDRVKVVPPADSDTQWMSFNGRFGTVGKVLLETQYTGVLHVAYRIDLDSPPRGRDRVLWCKEHFLVGAEKGGKSA